MKLGISILFVKDIQKSKTFYIETLGIDYMPEFSDEKFVMLKPSNDVFVGLQDLTTAEINPNEFKAGASELGFEVDAVDELWQNLISKGLTLKEPENKPFGRVFYTEDPDGHKLSFYKHAPM